jgi:serine protease
MHGAKPRISSQIARPAVAGRRRIGAQCGVAYDLPSLPNKGWRSHQERDRVGDRRNMLHPRRYGLLVLCFASLLAGAAEWNPVRQEPLSIGPESHRFIVGFRATPDNQTEQLVRTRRHAEGVRIVQAQTTPADVQALAQRTGIRLARSRQLTPSMHVLFLPKTLYGADVAATLAQLRADPAVEFADVDARRYALAGGSMAPNDPLFLPTPAASPPASGQWYLNTPGGTFTLEGNPPTQDLAATDAVSAWSITTGSTGVVIADVDTGVIFDHPDLLRAGATSLGSGFGGRLLPGYDFVGEDYSPNSPYGPLGTFDIANDGDGWDPDPSDPGDWITQTDVNNPNGLFTGDQVEGSSWHGTRVVGVYGALTNNGVGVAGMSWGSWILPVRALGKGGGYDSDIMSGILWAAGLPVSGVPTNPYPADIINLSLGGATSVCDASSTYGNPTSGLPAVTSMGVLVVIAAGNGGNPGQTAPVETPANCSATVSGVVAVAGLRNVGTKVGYSSFGPEVTVAAPAGNCIQTSGDCLRSIDTTTNLGATGPGANSYTNEQNPNLGTSFATPIVSGIAALMRSANANLTPAQLVARLQASAAAFPPNTNNLLVCPSNDSSSGECSCLGSGQCGAGMVNALSAVQAAQAPIGVISIPSTVSGGSVLDASASLPGCNASAVPAVPLSIASFAWTANPTSLIGGGANTAKVTVTGGSGALTLAITDSAGNVDTETVTLSGGSAVSSAPSSASGTSASACPTAVAVNIAAPMLSASFAPASVAPNVSSTLTFTFTNANSFDLTQASFSTTLPTGLAIKTSGSPAVPETATTCTGAAMALTSTTSSVSISNANIPANGSCTITATVQSANAGTYSSSLAANTLLTGPAGGNAVAASASLSVNAPSGGGGGALGWPQLLVAAGVVAASRRRARRSSTPIASRVE